jgi:hypothetical protein
MFFPKALKTAFLNFLVYPKFNNISEDKRKNGTDIISGVVIRFVKLLLKTKSVWEESNPR